MGTGLPSPSSRQLWGWGAYSHKGCTLSSQMSSRPHPRPTSQPMCSCTLLPSLPFPFQFNQANLLLFPGCWLGPRTAAFSIPRSSPTCVAGLHLQEGDQCSYRAQPGVEAVSGRSLVISSCIHPGDGSPDLKGYPGKLRELQAGKGSSLQIPQLVEEEISNLLQAPSMCLRPWLQEPGSS